MLDALKKHGKVVALATSKPEVHALRILEKYQLIAFFDCIVGSELDGTRSEKAEVILEVFRRLKLSPEQQQQALMVGDRKFDILGAKACGIHSVGVRFGYAEENELEQAGADYIVDTVEALTRFLVSH
jgi:phosphoglycolate phosphatase